MIHMLSSFDLKPGVDWDRFAASYDAFIQELIGAGIILSAGPPGHRVSDTPMDTDEARTHQCFSLMTFRSRAQMDAAYAHIEARLRPGTHSHIAMYRLITNSVFLCWQDGPIEGETT